MTVLAGIEQRRSHNREDDSDADSGDYAAGFLCPDDEGGHRHGQDNLVVE